MRYLDFLRVEGGGGGVHPRHDLTMAPDIQGPARGHHGLPALFSTFTSVIYGVNRDVGFHV